MTEQHSLLGGSGAHRWINCPGSVALARSLAAAEEPPRADAMDEPDYQRDGIQAHALAAWCLQHEPADTYEAPLDLFPDLNSDMMSAVQQYVDFVRTLPGLRSVEMRLARPDLHPEAFGTVDVMLRRHSTQPALRIVDYKHGAGVMVEPVENPQMMYYALLVIGLDATDYDDGEQVELTIVQPRYEWHPDGVVRNWTTTTGAIRSWGRDVLLPAMHRVETDAYFQMGDWCRFCPAKLVCPAMHNLARKAIVAGSTVTFGEAQLLKMCIKAVEKRAYAAAQAGHPEPGTKLVYKLTDRVWKADAPLDEAFGADAWIRTRPSPAAVEAWKTASAKAFVAEWAYKPQTELTTVVSATDRRPEVKPPAPEEVWD